MVNESHPTEEDVRSVLASVLALLVGILVVLAITGATGYFVAQEFAFMAVDRASLRVAAEAGDHAAQRTLRVTRRTSFMLSGAQLGITVTGLVVGYVAEPLIGESISTLLGGASVPDGVGVAIGTTFALLLSTFVQMIFGELFPKNLAIARPDAVARRLSRSTVIYLRVVGWLVRVFDAASNALLRLLRIEPVHDVEHSATVRDLEHIVEDSRAAGELPEQLSIMLDRILDFPDETVQHAMIARAHVATVDPVVTVRRLLDVMRAGHSRYPVLDTHGAVSGVIHLVDVLDADSDATAGELARPACVVPTTMSLPDALRTLTERHEQLACVLDEYGGLAGVLTREDLAEEVVGEITDEHDAASGHTAVDNGDGTWTSAGDVLLDELARTMHIELPEGDYETVAGLIVAAHGTFPEAKDVVDIPLPLDAADLLLDDPPNRVLRAEVLQVVRHIPAQVLLTIVETPAEQPGHSS